MSITYAELLNNCRVTAQTPLPLDNIYLAINMNIIGSEGNFVALTGLPGASKSTFVSAIIASAISREEVFNFKVLTYENKSRICLFDTEQMGYDLHRKLGIIKKLARRDNIFEIFDLFSVVDHDGDTILKLILTYLNNTPECAILIIDGLLDLSNGLFNDEKESTKLIRKIRKIARRYKILIIVVLHLGKKDNTALGHLGSASTRYCQSELEISKNKDNTYQCTAKKTRSAPGFDDIKIMYSEIEKRFILC